MKSAVAEPISSIDILNLEFTPKPQVSFETSIPVSVNFLSRRRTSGFDEKPEV